MSIDLVAGHLALDFANNRQRMRAVDPEDRFAGLLEFARSSGTTPVSELDRLARASRRQRDEAKAVGERADALAVAIGRVVDAALLGGEPPAADLARINREAAEAASRRRLTAGSGGFFEWSWDQGRPPALDRPLWPLARAATDLLVSGALSRVRRCGSSSCDWLFLDTSKNHSRCWCDMATCGNRAKVRRFRERAAAS